MRKNIGDSNKLTFFIVEDRYVHWYWNDSDLTRIRRRFFSRLKNDPNYLIKLKARWEVSLGNFDKIISKTHTTNLSNLSNDDLINLYDNFYKRFVDEFSFFMALGDAISMHADKYLVPEFKKTLGKDYNKIFPQLITTKYTSFLEKEQKSRSRLVEIYKKNKKVPRKLLDSHSRRFYYITNNYAKVRYLTADDFLKLIRKDARKKVIHSTKIKTISKRKLLRRYKIFKWQKQVLDVLDEFFSIQDTRKKYVLISNYYQFKFLQEAARRSRLSFELLQYSVFTEFSDIINNKIDQKKLKDRKKLSVCIQSNDNYSIYTGKEAQGVYIHFLKKKNYSQEIEGIVASKGVAVGVVKKILKIHDMVNMEDGDILVSSMTRPEMLPAMKRAGAIITDEGGITSHAAIVAREFGIPCIIGTKIATKVLKDGDRVEVDATKGVVRKI
ncbi:hypothetical protein IID19_02290 [Patescibacteria group bacterium]|nr:hypothetical protein [Patescibacteria group bacterium]